MDANQELMVGAALLLGVGLAWGVATWWFGRRLRAGEARLDKVDKARQFAAQQASQARRQIEGLQKELAELRLNARNLGARVPAVAASSAAPAADDFLPHANPAPDPEPPPDGFADTQLLQPRRP